MRLSDDEDDDDDDDDEGELGFFIPSPPAGGRAAFTSVAVAFPIAPVVVDEFASDSDTQLPAESLPRESASAGRAGRRAFGDGGSEDEPVAESSSDNTCTASSSNSRDPRCGKAMVLGLICRAGRAVRVRASAAGCTAAGDVRDDVVSGGEAELVLARAPERAMAAAALQASPQLTPTRSARGSAAAGARAHDGAAVLKNNAATRGVRRSAVGTAIYAASSRAKFIYLSIKEQKRISHPFPTGKVG